MAAFYIGGAPAIFGNSFYVDALGFGLNVSSSSSSSRNADGFLV
jgi:hypothetical protein